MDTSWRAFVVTCQHGEAIYASDEIEDAQAHAAAMDGQYPDWSPHRVIEVQAVRELTRTRSASDPEPEG